MSLYHGAFHKDENKEVFSVLAFHKDEIKEVFSVLAIVYLGLTWVFGMLSLPHHEAFEGDTENSLKTLFIRLCYKLQ